MSDREYRIRVSDIPESLYYAILEEFERQWGTATPWRDFEEDFWVISYFPHMFRGISLQ